MPKITCPKCEHEFKMTKAQLFPPKEIANTHSKAIAEMIEIFSAINPTISYAHKGYRSDAEILINQFGEEKALNTAKLAVSIQGEMYAPTITTPTALKYKIGDLMSYYKKITQGGRL